MSLGFRAPKVEDAPSRPSQWPPLLLATRFFWGRYHQAGTIKQPVKQAGAQRPQVEAPETLGLPRAALATPAMPTTQGEIPKPWSTVQRSPPEVSVRLSQGITESIEATRQAKLKQHATGCGQAKGEMPIGPERGVGLFL